MLLKRNRVNTNNVAEGRLFPTFVEFRQIVFTFLITMLAWVFFRARSVSDALLYIKGMFNESIITIPDNLTNWLISLFFIFVLVFVEWLQREKEHALELHNLNISRNFRWSFYVLIFFTIFWYGGDTAEFIYFQF
jgi:hypothetical protein